jgi:hypothetical protein
MRDFSIPVMLASVFVCSLLVGLGPLVYSCKTSLHSTNIGWRRLSTCLGYINEKVSAHCNTSLMCISSSYTCISRAVSKPDPS